MSFNYQQTGLGQETNYASDYNPQLLCPLPRKQGRQELGLLNSDLPFQGVDVWHNYEASWLNANGKPQVAIVQLLVPCTSAFLIESKSLKLYFNSLNFKKFDSQNDFLKLLETDLSQAAQAPIKARLFAVDSAYQLRQLQGQSLDDVEIECADYVLNPSILTCQASAQIVSESVYSHLLRSNCPVTNQPDWGSVQISYTGCAINHENLLRYLISFRQHNDFHEQCVERIFTDIMHYCQPQQLTVQAYYTRRGGLDINPYRSNSQPFVEFERLARQ